MSKSIKKHIGYDRRRSGAHLVVDIRRWNKKRGYRFKRQDKAKKKPTIAATILQQQPTSVDCLQ